MAPTCPKLKSKLENQETPHVSNFCVRQTKPFFFNKKSEALRKLVVLQFILCCKNTIETNFFQASVTTIHTINCKSQINFIVSGNNYLYSAIATLLHFLRAKPIQIQQIYFYN
jgi:roadblock/LC7 domain-containing protein